jgi:hypothetical protein
VVIIWAALDSLRESFPTKTSRLHPDVLLHLHSPRESL